MPNASQTTPRKAPKSKPGPKGIPIELILDYTQNKGLDYTQTAKLLGCTKGNVSERLSTIGLGVGNLNKYKSNRADVLASYQLLFLNSIRPDQLKRASLSQLVMAFGIMFDKERLERDKSTSNVAYADMSKAADVASAAIDRYLDRYGADSLPAPASETP